MRKKVVVILAVVTLCLFCMMGCQEKEKEESVSPTIEVSQWEIAGFKFLGCQSLKDETQYHDTQVTVHVRYYVYQPTGVVYFVNTIQTKEQYRHDFQMLLDQNGKPVVLKEEQKGNDEQRI